MAAILINQGTGVYVTTGDLGLIWMKHKSKAYKYYLHFIYMNIYITGKNYTNRLQLLIVYVFMCNNLETMKNKHEMSGKGKTVVFPCDSTNQARCLIFWEYHLFVAFGSLC